jgi:hypothetical protein
MNNIYFEVLKSSLLSNNLTFDEMKSENTPTVIDLEFNGRNSFGFPYNKNYKLSFGFNQNEKFFIKVDEEVKKNKIIEKQNNSHNWNINSLSKYLFLYKTYYYIYSCFLVKTYKKSKPKCLISRLNNYIYLCCQ